MANIRQDILTKLATVLGYITTTNSYNNTLVNYKRGYVASNEVNEYPYGCYFLSNENLLEKYETLNKYKSEINIIIYDSVNSDFANTGTLSDKYENWIADMKRFAKNISSKGFPVTLSSNDLLEVYYDNVKPYLDFQNNKMELQFTFIVEYVE